MVSPRLGAQHRGWQPVARSSSERRGVAAKMAGHIKINFGTGGSLDCASPDQKKCGLTAAWRSLKITCTLLPGKVQWPDSLPRFFLEQQVDAAGRRGRGRLLLFLSAGCGSTTLGRVPAPQLAEDDEGCGKSRSERRGVVAEGELLSDDDQPLSSIFRHRSDPARLGRTHFQPF